MSIVGLEGLDAEEVRRELDRGAKFVIFEYCVSILIMTFKRGSKIHFVKGDEGTFGKALPYTLLSLLLGWWGIPWGPIYTITALVTNLRGGKDVTAGVLAAMQSPGDP